MVTNAAAVDQLSIMHVMESFEWALSFAGLLALLRRNVTDEPCIALV
jgi:hypothetical protein